MSVWIILAVLVAVALAAPRYGADTRTSDGWTAGRTDRPGPRARASVRADLARLVAVMAGNVRSATSQRP